MKLSIGMAVMALCATAICGVRDERLRELENICAYVPSDDLDVEERMPTPDDIIRKYNVTTNDVIQDLRVVAAKYSLSETNVDKRVTRDGAISFLGQYGGTNELSFVTSILTNGADYAATAALGASMAISARVGGLTNLVEWVVSDTNTFDSSMRRTAYIWMYDIVAEGSSFTNNQGVVDLVREFFMRRARMERGDSVLFVDRVTCNLYPSYRHSQQRRDNLAALRPPGLTGRPAELYDAAQRDAAQGE